jgi:hypothetical protein
MEFDNFEKFIEETGAPSSVTNRLEDLKMVRERPDYHPENSVYEHIKIVTERLMKTGDPDLILSGCLHDLFKLDTLRINPKTGYPTFPGHDKEVAIFIGNNKEIQDWIKRVGGDLLTVQSLCKDHMRFHQFALMRKAKQDEFVTRPHWNKLKVLGAADNMLEEFDINNLEKSWKWSRFQ